MIFMVRTDNKTYFFIMFYRVLVLLVVLDFLNDLGDLKPTKHCVNLSTRVTDLNGYNSKFTYQISPFSFWRN